MEHLYDSSKLANSLDISLNLLSEGLRRLL